MGRMIIKHNWQCQLKTTRNIFTLAIVIKVAEKLLRVFHSILEFVVCTNLQVN